MIIANETMKKKVLIITYYFPPINRGGIIRTLKFVKYLPSYRWNSIVLTSSDEFCDPSVYDSSLLNEVPSDTKICRVGSLNPVNFINQRQKQDDEEKNRDLYGNKSFQQEQLVKRLFKSIYKIINYILIPDANILWAFPAIIKAKKLVQTDDISLIYTTSPNHSTHLIGYVLKKVTGIPWVADFRDGWTENPLFKTSYKIRASIEKYMERKVLESADKIICATEPIACELKSAHTFIESTKFIVITNGFDLDDFKNINNNESTRFTITYTGKLDNIKTPNYFIKALKQLADEHKELKQKMQVFFVGSFPENSKYRIKELHIENIIRPVGYVSHRESVRYQLQTDVLLLILFEEEDGSAVHPGKLFEYIAAKKPILALTPKGITADIIKSEGLGKVVPSRDIDAIKDAIYEMYLQYKQGTLELKNAKSYEKFERKELTRQLAKVFDDVGDVNNE